MHDRVRTGVALLAAAALFMELLDATVIVTALPTIAGDFGRHALDLNVTILAYTVAAAVLMPISGWLSTRFGTREVFLVAVAIFTAASGACAASSDLTFLTVARAVQGAGGAMMIPVGRTAVLRDAQKSEIIRLVAILTWPALVAPVLGPPVGGFIVTHASWRWIFLINIPLGALAMVIGWWLLPPSTDIQRRSFDLLGAVLFGTASVALMIGLERFGHADAAWPTTLAIAALGLLSGFAALGHLSRAREPLFSLAAMRHRSFAIGIGSGSVYRIVISALPFMLPLMFQLSFGLSAVQAGTLVMAVFVGNMVMKPFTTRVLRRFGFRKALYTTGLVVAGTVLACALFTQTTPRVVIAFVLFLSGLARSMQFTALNTVAFADLDAAETSDANTLSVVVQQLTASLGIAVGTCAIRLSAWITGTAPTSTVSFSVAFVLLGTWVAIESLRLLRLPHDVGASLNARPVPSN